MKKTSLTSISLVACLLSAHAVTVSSFGTDIGASDLIGAWAGNYTSGTSTVVSTDAPGAGILDFTGPAIDDVTGLGSLQLAADASVSPDTNFVIKLYDNEGDFVEAGFNWSSFSAVGTQTVSSTLTTNVLFDGSNVFGWELATGGIGNGLTAQFSSLSAVPEPSTYAALAGLCALGYVMVRRRRA